MKKLLIMFVCMMSVAPVQAASFDCAKAATKIEKMICGDAGLSKLDEELNVAYKTALQDEKQATSTSSGQADTVKQAQKQWVKERNGCFDAGCVKRAYETRLSTLTSSDDEGTTHEVAGKYKMIEDSIYIPQSDGITKVEKNAEVCTAFLKNLEAFPPFPPMACDVKFKPEFTDFKTPEWQDIDVWENRDLWLQLARTPPKDNIEKEQRLAYLKDRIKSGMVVFRTARFDIDNDGVPDKVLRISNDKCDPANGKTNDVLGLNNPSYTVYDPVTRKVDVKKDAFYDRYWSHYISLFSFKGLTYYASLLGDTTSEPYFEKLERPSKYGFLPTKYYIKLFRPLTMEQGNRTTWKQPAALGCEYLYLPKNNEGGY